MNIDDLEVLQQELYDDDWEFVTKYVTVVEDYGHWQREVYHKDGIFKAMDVYYNDGVEDFTDPFTVAPEVITIYNRV